MCAVDAEGIEDTGEGVGWTPMDRGEGGRTGLVCYRNCYRFNAAGACPECRGAGSIAVEMSFLDDVRTTCTTCNGRRYTDEVLALTWDGLSIWDVLSLTATEALERFAGDRDLRPTLQLLVRHRASSTTCPSSPAATRSSTSAPRAASRADVSSSPAHPKTWQAQESGTPPATSPRSWACTRGSTLRRALAHPDLRQWSWTWRSPAQGCEPLPQDAGAAVSR